MLNYSNHGRIVLLKTTREPMFANLLRKAGITVVKNWTYDSMLPVQIKQSVMEDFFRELDRDEKLRAFIQEIIGSPALGSARLLSDRFAAFALGRGRRFLEIGAWEPLLASETAWLEKEMGWSGLLVEPNPEMAVALRENRTSEVLEAAVVSTDLAHQDFFLQVDAQNSDKARVSKNRRGLRVDTVSLQEIFTNFGVPDALFIDIEGGELEVLRDFRSCSALPTFVCVETIWNKGEIHETLTTLGYEIKWPFLSGYNSWYWLGS